MTKIFISYSRVDKREVKQFAGLLEHGYEVWYDKGIRGGEDWWQRIISEIDNCDHYIYLLSNDSADSKWCQKELDRAIELDKHIIPVLIRDRTKLLDKISHLHTIDAFGDKLTDGISRIYGSILRTGKTEVRAELSEAHRKSDLRLIKKFWELLPSWYFSTQLNEELGIGAIVYQRYSERIHEFEHIIYEPVFKFNNILLEELFPIFADRLSAFIYRTATEFTTEDNGYFVSHYQSILRGNTRVNPYGNSEKDRAVVENKKKGFDDVLELYKEAKQIYLQIIDVIRGHYPEFDFLSDDS